ncbi:MAG: DUF692 family multinuclear iron-containing protein [Pseudomonadota bacterium]
MFQVCLPVSHLIEKGSPAVRELAAGADVLELRKPVNPEHLPEKPKIFHWGYGPVQDEFIPAFKKQGLADFLSETETDLFSFDLGPACRNSHFVLPLSRTLSRKEIIDRSAASLEVVRKAYAGPLAAENYNYYPTGLYEHICRPDFMAEYLEELNLGLVLDVAHAVISAVNMKLEPMKYISELPLDRVAEVHISRPFLHPCLAVDAHLAPNNEGFDLLTLILDRLPQNKSIPVAIEYYRDLKRLTQSYHRLRRLLNGS